MRVGMRLNSERDDHAAVHALHINKLGTDGAAVAKFESPQANGRLSYHYNVFHEYELLLRLFERGCACVPKPLLIAGWVSRGVDDDDEADEIVFESIDTHPADGRVAVLEGAGTGNDADDDDGDDEGDSGGGMLKLELHMPSSSCVRLLVSSRCGPDLEVLVKQAGGEFTLGTVAWLATQLLCCLEAVHDAGVIHRNIKPGNVCVGWEDPTQLKLIDFATAVRYVRDDGTHRGPSKTTGTSTKHGQSRYASINALAGKRQSRRDDVEALVYTLYELLVGETGTPWGSGASAVGYRLILFAGPPCIASHKQAFCARRPANCPPFLHALLTHARELRYDQRPDYAGMRAMIAASVPAEEATVAGTTGAEVAVPAPPKTGADASAAEASPAASGAASSAATPAAASGTCNGNSGNHSDSTSSRSGDSSGGGNNNSSSGSTSSGAENGMSLALALRRLLAVAPVDPPDSTGPPSWRLRWRSSSGMRANTTQVPLRPLRRQRRRIARTIAGDRLTA